jgi:hypothetical protein
MGRIANRAARWGSARLSRRLSRSVPVIGAAIAVATVVATMRRKGVIGGVFDTGLNAIPGIGAAKNLLEMARGRDFFPDRVGAHGSTFGARPENPPHAGTLRP